jgi:hypothetical protein
MPKKIAVISYSLTSSDTLTADANVFFSTLNNAGYQAELVPQSYLDESAPSFKNTAYWKGFNGIVICNFYYFWPLREIILSQVPVICANIGYVDDLGLAEQPVDHAAIASFTLSNNTHPITTGLALGSIAIGGSSSVWTDSTSTLDHDVTTLAVTSTTKHPILVAHKKLKLVYFGWYRMSQAPAGSPLFTLLVNAANWAF